MSNLVLADEIKHRNDYLTFLLKQYEAAWGQLTRTLSEMDKITLREQITALEKDMKQVKEELEELEAEQRCQVGPKVNTAQQRHWEEYLPEINFDRPLEQIQTIMDRFEDDAGVALFLLPDSTTTRAELFVARLRRWLEQRARLPGKIKYHRVELSEHNQLTPWLLLKRLGSLLDCPPPATGDQSPDQLSRYATTVIDTLYQTMEVDNTLLLELTVVADLCTQEAFLSWFLQTFWIPLAHKLPEEAHNRPMLKFLAVITTEDLLPTPPASSQLYCLAEQFDGKRITYLPLDYWTEQEIRRWLIRFAGLHHHLATAEIYNVAQMIYIRSRKGEPLRVEVSLRQELQRIFTATT